MNYIDLIIGILLILAAIRGYRKGFVHELASLAALVLGVWGAVYYAPYIAAILENNFSWQFEHIRVVAFLIAFLLIVVLVHYLGVLLQKLVESIALGFLNQIAGLLFGLLKAAFVLSVLLYIYEEFDPEGTVISLKSREVSRVYEPVRDLAPSILPFFRHKQPDRTPSRDKTLKTAAYKKPVHEFC